jgi:hypothetical protein
MSKVEFFLADPVAGQAVLQEAFAAQGFTVTTEAGGAWKVARGSTAVTAFLGAWAGKRQRMVFSVAFFQDGPRLVARFEKIAGTGGMGGAIGMARASRVFEQTAAEAGERLRVAGVLAAPVVKA